MTVLIAFGTIEGQTGKIAQAVEKQIRDAGEDVVCFDTADKTAAFAFHGIDKAILAASVHERRHPKTFEIFVTTNRETLSKLPTLLLSVSLKAAFDDGREEAQDYADEMKLRTGLDPDHELLVAGAFRTDSYDYYASSVLEHVVLKDHDLGPSVRDHEFTDWDGLATSVADFLKAHPER